MTEQTEKKSWFKKVAESYNKLCDDLGVNQGACRGCVPVVKFDPESEKETKTVSESKE